MLLVYTIVILCKSRSQRRRNNSKSRKREIIFRSIRFNNTLLTNGGDKGEEMKHNCNVRRTTRGEKWKFFLSLLR